MYRDLSAFRSCGINQKDLPKPVTVCFRIFYLYQYEVKTEQYIYYNYKPGPVETAVIKNFLGELIILIPLVIAIIWRHKLKNQNSDNNETTPD
jgi:hypothetical protein